MVKFETCSNLHMLVNSGQNAPTTVEGQYVRLHMMQILFSALRVRNKRTHITLVAMSVNLKSAFTVQTDLVRNHACVKLSTYLCQYPN